MYKHDVKSIGVRVPVRIPSDSVDARVVLQGNRRRPTRALNDFLTRPRHMARSFLRPRPSAGRKATVIFSKLVSEGCFSTGGCLNRLETFTRADNELRSLFSTRYRGGTASDKIQITEQWCVTGQRTTAVYSLSFVDDTRVCGRKMTEISIANA